MLPELDGVHVTLIEQERADVSVYGKVMVSGMISCILTNISVVQLYVSFARLKRLSFWSPLSRLRASVLNTAMPTFERMPS